MKNLAKSLVVATAIGLVGAQAYAQSAAITVRDAPVHKVPADDNGPVENNAPPDTLNAQFAAQSRPAPAFLSKVSDSAPSADAPQSEAPRAEASKAAEAKADTGPSAPIAARIIDAAGAFEAYMRKTSALSGKFSDGTSVAKAMAVGSSYETQQFQEGATAYAALAALQDPAFVQGVFDMSRDPRDRAAMTERLLAHPDAVMDIDGADEAGAMAGAILARMGADLVHAGQTVKQASYEVQHQAWSKEDVSHADQRLAAAKAISTVKVSLNAADTDALIKTIVALRKTEGQSSAGRAAEPTPIIQHGLAVAALAVMGRAGDGQIERIAPLLSDAKSADCMKMAKLNLYQCMAAAGPEYEDVFCLGAHAMIDTGQCLISASGQTPIPEGALQRASAPVPASRSVSVPIALMSTEGPERQRARAARAPEREVPVASPAEEVATLDAPPPPVAAPRDYAEQAPRRVARAYAPAPRAAPRDDDYAYDDRPAPPAATPYGDRYDDRYQAPARQSYRDDYRSRDDAYADAYGPPAPSYGYGR